jgi:hypothetical protein
MEIEDFYGDRVAKRSGVPLMNHITEGTKLLEYLGATKETIRAYRLHPIYQNDSDLFQNYLDLVYERTVVSVYIMEYRNIANASLSNNVFRDHSQDWSPLRFQVPIKLSPIDEVNDMLIADKCQNYKDFLKYHYGTHLRSDELDFYFTMWLKALRVSDSAFNTYREVMSN